MTDYTEGVDFARYQGDVDFDEVRNAGARFAFLKATEGESYVDPTYYRNAARGSHNAVWVGAYHYFRPDQDPEKQAEHFARVAEDCTSLRPAPDFETLKAIEPLEAFVRCKAFCVATEVLWKARPILYSYFSFLDANHAASTSTGLHEFDLWLAHYTKKPAPSIPRSWQSWLVWQFDGDGGKRLPSGTDCDWNRVRTADFQRLLRRADSLLRL